MDGCMLGAFLLPAFTCIGYERNDLLSLCDGTQHMCAQTRPLFVLSSESGLGNGVRTHVNSKGKIPSTGGSEEDRTRNTTSSRTVSLTHYQLSYPSPPGPVLISALFAQSCQLLKTSSEVDKTECQSFWENFISYRITVLGIGRVNTLDWLTPKQGYAHRQRMIGR